MTRQIVFLTHLRWLAAALVAVSHFRSNLMQDFAGGGFVERGFYFLTGFGHAGVVVFFVLSGFLVGQKVRHMAGQAEPDLHRYFVDRFARIFTVAWPAVSFACLAFAAVVMLRPDAPFVTGPGWSLAMQAPLAGDLDPLRWLAAATMLNGLTAATPVMDGPLWSLAYEWTYYVAAGAGVALWRRRWHWSIPYAAALLVLAAAFEPWLLVGGLVWLLGMSAGAVADRGWLRGRASLLLIAVLTAGALVWWRWRGLHDLLLAVPIAALVAHTAWQRWTAGGKAAERLAAYSYTFYATHFPISVLFMVPLAARLPFGWAGVGYMSAAFLVSVLFAWLLGQVTERHTGVVRRWLMSAARPAQRLSPARDS